jgi:hypothetical protein
MTSHPASAKLTERGRPTYPSPTMPIFIATSIAAGGRTGP